MEYKRYKLLSIGVVGVLVAIVAVIVVNINGVGARELVKQPVVTNDAQKLAVIPDYQLIDGRGTEIAPEALKSALTKLPFKALSPTYLPTGTQLNHTIAHFTGTDKVQGALDVFYKLGNPAIGTQLHIYQTNQDLGGKPEASQHITEQRQITAGAHQWNYQLLSWPQPDGSEIKSHVLTRNFGEVYFTIRIEVGSDSKTSFNELQKIVNSLQ